LTPNGALRTVAATVKKTRLLLFVWLVVAAAPALAHHRQTPAVVLNPLPGSDNFWPRLPALGERLAVALDTPSGRQIFQRQRDRRTFLQITTSGNNDNPSVSARRDALAWDSDGDFLGNHDPGRQIYVLAGNMITQATHDPSGTATNPSFNGAGTRLAFQSQGQIFVRLVDGTTTQVSTGMGTSSNPAYSEGGSRLVWQSTSHPVTGADTGVAQVWVLGSGGAAPITDGQGPSTRPLVNPIGRLVVFESTAALAGNGHDTGVSQVFVYDIAAQLFTQVTNDPAGCSAPTIGDNAKNAQVSYVCDGVGYYRFLKSGQTFRLPITGGDTAQAANAGGLHFIQVSTTANLLAGGVHAGHQLYQLNLFKTPGTEVAAPPLVSFP
jgi:Tol biopolymer transport system component